MILAGLLHHYLKQLHLQSCGMSVLFVSIFLSSIFSLYFRCSLTNSINSIAYLPFNCHLEKFLEKQKKQINNNMSSLFYALVLSAVLSTLPIHMVKP